MHHICTRPHDLPGTVEQASALALVLQIFLVLSLPKARLSKIGDMTEEDAYNHSDNARQHAFSVFAKAK